MRPIFFCKMEGTGNNFLIIDNRHNYLGEEVKPAEMPEFVKRLANCSLGAGADGVIIVERSGEYPFAMHYYNQDGSEADICLNGARCLVSYAHRLGLIREKGKFISASGPIGFYHKGETISIEVTPPLDIKLNFTFTIKKKKLRANYLKLGVPHCVIFVDSFEKIDIKELGQAIRNHRQFKPDGVNVNFVKTEKDHLFVRTYERGVEDETFSCGSGVVASAYIATKLFMTEPPVTCRTRGGDLTVDIKEKLYLEGPANVIYDGVYYYG